MEIFFEVLFMSGLTSSHLSYGYEDNLPHFSKMWKIFLWQDNATRHAIQLRVVNKNLYKSANFLLRKVDDCFLLCQISFRDDK